MSSRGSRRAMHDADDAALRCELLRTPDAGQYQEESKSLRIKPARERGPFDTSIFDSGKEVVVGPGLSIWNREATVRDASLAAQRRSMLI
jgi:hypothetical protein